jgi:hypothetical protein
MMVVWPKHFAAVTSEEKRKNCCVDGPLIAEFLLISLTHTLIYPVLRDDAVSVLKTFKIVSIIAFAFSFQICLFLLCAPRIPQSI